jgi:hypothetical protein
VVVLALAREQATNEPTKPERKFAPYPREDSAGNGEKYERREPSRIRGQFSHEKESDEHGDENEQKAGEQREQNCARSNQNGNTRLGR